MNNNMNINDMNCFINCDMNMNMNKINNMNDMNNTIDNTNNYIYNNMINNMNNFMSNNMFNPMSDMMETNKHDYMNKKYKIEFLLEATINFYFKYLTFGQITISCSSDDLISEVIEKFTEKINIKSIKWKFKNLNHENKVINELGYTNDVYRIYVSNPTKDNKKIKEISQKLKLIDDEIDKEIYSIHLKGNFNGTIYVRKKKKSAVISSLKNELSDLSYVSDEFFSKLFGKEDKIYKIIKYCKESESSYDEINDLYVNGKKININLTIEEAGLKNNSLIIVWKDNYLENVSFQEFSGKRYNINYKPFEFVTTLIERYRKKSNNYGGTFIYNAKKLPIENNNLAYFLKPNSIIIVIP